MSKESSNEISTKELAVKEREEENEQSEPNTERPPGDNQVPVEEPERNEPPLEAPTDETIEEQGEIVV